MTWWRSTNFVTKNFLQTQLCPDLISNSVQHVLSGRIVFRTYARANDLNRAGGVFLRPWMLVYSAESGVKGLMEPDARPLPLFL